MYLRVSEGYADQDLQYLSELLNTLDNIVVDTVRRMSNSADPESDGLTDRGEYFVGIGFCAYQQNITDTLTRTGISKERALTLGPCYYEEMTFIAIVNAAANWWKHSAEWVGQNENNSLARRTQEVIAEVTETEDYALSNVLAKLLGTGDIKLSALLPSLVLWRETVDHKRM
ncbi:MAG: hypothetical protein CMQ46_10450 [Gammaproteobacteria bacterium]|nr:hypothetical protein [Gammaproteobacteria bacterium]MBJ55667.1 hypothetical protein [Gammaproteobacteria bacterium]HBN14365.1 hypothetical protein [Pseudohongiella sp.]|tara:strand:- start:97 stop:612 length:516 start_codon:yes stop_codon:yes gene_type:complete